MINLFFEALLGAFVWKKNIECNCNSFIVIVPNNNNAMDLFKLLYDELEDYLSEHNYNDIIIISDSEKCVIKINKKITRYVNISSKKMRELISYCLLTSKPTGNLMRRNVRVICPELFLGGQFNKLLENNIYPASVLVRQYLLYAEID